MSEVKFLTLQELCIKLRVSESAARRMLKDGKLVGIKLANGEWRICDPGQRFEQYLHELNEHLLHVPTLNVREAAELIGCTHLHVYKLVKRKKLVPGLREGKRREMFFTVAEVRRHLQEKQKLARPSLVTVQMRELIEWSHRLLKKDDAENAENARRPVDDRLEKLVDKIFSLPEPQRTSSLLELFRKLEKARVVIDAEMQADQHRLIN